MTISDFLKNTFFQAALVGAFGGMAPKLIELIPKLFNNVFPSSGYVLALVLLAIIGAIVVLVYKEQSLQKALVLGAGAPAIIATLTANVVNQNPAGVLSLLNVSVVSVAHAQPATRMDTLRFVVMHNASPYKLNALWLRADAKNVDQYQQYGDTLMVPIPQDTKEVRVNLPGETQSFIVPASDIPKNKHIHINIIDNKNTRDFWKTFGNVNLPQFKIDKVESEKK